MKRLSLLAWIALSIAFTSCKKNADAPVITDTPRTEVPAEMLTAEGKYWTIGTISSVYFHNTSSGAYYDYVRNGGGVVVFFKFKPGGYFENLVYVVANSYGTSTETWTSIEGTVEFTQKQGKDVFITHANKGIYRIRKNVEQSSRPVPVADLKDQHSNTFLYAPWENDEDPNRTYTLMLNLDWYPQVDLNDLDNTVKPEWVNKFHIED
ncbi:hypothetical protein [Foetidibacter luteolus]|uniref:hypothetical protein n=1 Tax=Foetidibacter luteolus TaxID=2608880 RepID=UPI00129B3153|nr:hypothetical protein [Foetidibacter luteolus]